VTGVADIERRPADRVRLKDGAVVSMVGVARAHRAMVRAAWLSHGSLVAGVAIAYAAVPGTGLFGVIIISYILVRIAFGLLLVVVLAHLAATIRACQLVSRLGRAAPWTLFGVVCMLAPFAAIAAALMGRLSLVVVPISLLAAFAAKVMLNMAVRSILKRHRYSPGLLGVSILEMSRATSESMCRCGYDLRGLTENQCPECGVPVCEEPA